jgi:hypothetical protein
MVQRVRLEVGAPAPTVALPKAILELTFKDPSNDSVVLRSSTRCTQVMPLAVLEAPLSAAEVGRLPVNTRVVVVAELRWPSSKPGRTCRAYGSSELVVVDQYVVTGTGTAVGPERELVDMTRFRPFWNKVWESPSLAVGPDGRARKRYAWGLDVALKYTALLAPGHDTNGLMETRLLRAPSDESAVADRAEGRMKAGVDLSVKELAKLATLWDSETALPPDKLAAFDTEAFARDQARDAVVALKLEGRRSERGLVWAVPVFGLFSFTLGRVVNADDGGQVTELGTETARLPLPVAVRILGLLNDGEAADEGASSLSDDSSDGPGYAFDGYHIAVSQRVALLPVAIAPAPSAAAPDAAGPRPTSPGVPPPWTAPASLRPPALAGRR